MRVPLQSAQVMEAQHVWVLMRARLEAEVLYL
jgi:hypothetical protein